MTQDAAEDVFPSLSIDGKQVVFRSNRSVNWDLWRKDLETGRESPLTTDPADQTFSHIAGSRLVYEIVDGRKRSTHAVALESGRPGAVGEKACEACGVLSEPIRGWLTDSNWTPVGLQKGRLRGAIYEINGLTQCQSPFKAAKWRGSS